MMGMMKLQGWDTTLCFWTGNSKDDNLEVFVPLCSEFSHLTYMTTIVARIKVPKRLQNWWAISSKGRAAPFSGNNHFETQPNVNLIHRHPGVIGKHETRLVFPKLHETWLEPVSLPRTHANHRLVSADSAPGLYPRKSQGSKWPPKAFLGLLLLVSKGNCGSASGSPTLVPTCTYTNYFGAIARVLFFKGTHSWPLTSNNI